MSRQERIVLDPAEVATAGRTELDLHSGPIQVREGGIDWGQAEVEAFMAQHELGESPVDFRLPNRVITIPLMLGAEGDYDAARLSLQAKVSRINEEGGWLKRELIGGSYGEAGGHLFCDLVKATLKYGGSTFAASNGVDPDAELVLEALPDFYGDPIEASLFEGTGEAVSTFQIKGNLPGRVDLAVYEESGNDQRGLAWGFRCRNYSSASTARLSYNASSLRPLDQASLVTLSGAYGSKAIRHNKLSTEWTPVLDNRISGAFPTHVGVYDVWVRARCTGALPWLRLVYDVGDVFGPSQNESAQLRGSGDFYLVNLGQVNLREAPIGTHRWLGVVQARGPSGGENIYVDKIWYLPADESSGTLGAATSYAAGAGVFAARDQLKGPEGPLTGRSAEVGGTHEALSGSDPDDYAFPWFSLWGGALRQSTSDSGTIAGGWKGRAVGLPVVLSSTAYSYRFIHTSDTTNLVFGQMVRVSGPENYVLVYFIRVPAGESGGKVLWRPRVWKQVGASGSHIYSLNEPTFDFTMSGYFGAEFVGRLLTVVVGDRLTVYVAPRTSSSFQSVLTLRDSDFTGALKTGGVYIFDENRGATAAYRYYSNLLAWAPDPDAVMFSNRNARLLSSGVLRQSADGSGLGEVAYARSDLPRVPCSGLEARPVEVFVKATRGDFSELPDVGIDKVAARLTYRPCWSNTPK